MKAIASVRSASVNCRRDIETGGHPLLADEPVSAHYLTNSTLIHKTAISV